MYTQNRFLYIIERKYMNGYINKPCGECGEKFTEKDDIAVCPECGTPVHRDCWKGECPNSYRHGSFDWEKENNTAVKEKPDKSVCAVCGEPVGERPIFCEECGCAMHFGCYMKNGECPNTDKHGEMEPDEDFTPGENDAIYINSYNSFAERVKRNPIRDKATGEPLTCHGVTQSELVYFLGQSYLSTPRYMGVFMRMAMTGKKVFFNLWQGLLMPFYQFYQKMFGPAIILTFATFILDIPGYMVDIMQFRQEGENAVISQELYSVWFFCNLAGIVLQLITAFLGDYLYMKWTVSRILNLRERYGNLPEDEYYAVLEKKGNPRWYFAFIGFGVSVALLIVFMHCMGYSPIEFIK